MPPLTQHQILRLQQTRLAKRALSASTLRAMPKGCSKVLSDYLANLSLSEFYDAVDREAFDRQWKRVVGELYGRLGGCSQSPKLGMQWGYAAKAVNVFLWDVCLHRGLTDAIAYKQMLPLLYCPLDRKVQEQLKQDGYKGPIKSIRGIDEETYYELQKVVLKYAKLKGLDRVEYDDLAFVGDDVEL